jgi:cell division protein FtsI/penicillin-binding protein 2
MFYLGFAVIIIKLTNLQLFPDSQYQNKITRQTYKLKVQNPLRGSINSSDQERLAFNTDYYLLSIYKPNLLDNLDSTISQITQTKPQFLIDNQSLIDLFKYNAKQKWITFPTAFSSEEIIFLKTIPGLEFKHYYGRNYPHGTLATQIIGTTITKNSGQVVGLSGLESYYQRQLSGKTGFAYSYEDALGNTIFPKKTWSLNKVDGQHLYTTINSKIQDLVETKLSQGLSKYQAESGSITIIESATGKLLAMASLPLASASASQINPAIFNLFEPGSIFKPLVVAMALDSKTITPSYICSQCHQPFVIGDYSITNWDMQTHPDSSLRDIIKNSDNIGMTTIIRRLGLPNFLIYYNSLGLSRKTGIDLQGEAKSIPKTSWPEIDLATASFGQGIALTQIKMLQIFNTLATDGLLLQPYVVDYLDNSQTQYHTKPKPPITIFQSGAVAQTRTILKYSVENGAVAKLKPKNLDVCAKSGTAQIAIKGKYSESSYASYIGFSPCDHPLFTMIVTLKNPQSSSWGSSTAAPIWFEIAAVLPNLL